MPQITDKSTHSFARKVGFMCKAFAKKHNLMQVKIKMNWIKGKGAKYDILSQVKCIVKNCNCKNVPFSPFCKKHDK